MTEGDFIYIDPDKYPLLVELLAASFTGGDEAQKSFMDNLTKEGEAELIKELAEFGEEMSGKAFNIRELGYVRQMVKAGNS